METGIKATVAYYGTFKMGNISEDRYPNPLSPALLSSDVLFPGMKSLFVQSLKAHLILTMDIFSQILTSECSLCRSNKLIYNSLTYILSPCCVPLSLPRQPSNLSPALQSLLGHGCVAKPSVQPQQPGFELSN